MPNKDGHRRFGNVRKLPSGRWQARYLGPDGRMRTAPQTFVRKSDAGRHLTIIEGQMIHGEWTDPERAKIKLGDYAARWIDHRPGLRPRTADRYRILLRKHIVPFLGTVQLGKLETDLIREWRAKLLGMGVSVSVAAKAYRLLRAVLMTAVEDRVIPRNPCRVKGAGDECPDERPVLTVTQAVELADLVGRRPIGNIRKLDSGRYRLRYCLDGTMRTLPETFPSRAAADRALWEMAETGQAEIRHDVRFRALVLLTTFASLRWGEVVALQRRDIDVDAGTVEVRQALVELDSGRLFTGPPKSQAGRRIVSIPAAIVPDIADHLNTYTGSGENALVFTGTGGGLLRRANFRRSSGWVQAVATLGVPNLHFHDLRHTGNTLAAQTGASTRDLMARMGHDSTRAAMIYQHATTVVDRRIADSLSVEVAKVRDDDPDDGPAGAPVPVT